MPAPHEHPTIPGLEILLGEGKQTPSTLHTDRVRHMTELDELHTRINQLEQGGAELVRSHPLLVRYRILASKAIENGWMQEGQTA